MANRLRRVNEILADVAERGDQAVVHWAKKFDDPEFTAEQIRVKPEEMKGAHGRVAKPLLEAIRQSIRQVRQVPAARAAGGSADVEA